MPSHRARSFAGAVIATGWASALAAAASEAPAGLPPVAAFGNLPALQYAGLSPSGRWLAVDEPHGAARRLVIFDAATGNRVLRAINLEDNNKLRDLTWADDETLLVEMSVQRAVPCGSAECRAEWFEDACHSDRMARPRSCC